MKKLIAAALGLFCFTSAMALDNEPKPGLTFQGQVGVDISNIRNSEYSAKAGANLGIYAQYMFEKAHGTYIMGGLNYAMKGNRKDLGICVNKNVLHYLQVPIHIGFQYNIIPELGVFADFGPFFAVAPGGRGVFSFDDDTIGNHHYNILKNHHTGDYNLFNGLPELGFQRFDWGIGIRFGAEYNQHYSLNVAMDWGVEDILRDTFRSSYPNVYPKYKTFNCAITLGYRF